MDLKSVSSCNLMMNRAESLAFPSSGTAPVYWSVPKQALVLHKSQPCQLLFCIVKWDADSLFSVSSSFFYQCSGETVPCRQFIWWILSLFPRVNYPVRYLGILIKKKKKNIGFFHCVDEHHPDTNVQQFWGSTSCFSWWASNLLVCLGCTECRGIPLGCI